MKSNFKKLGLAAAVAAVSAGYAGFASAQATAVYAGNFIGDAAIIPYYTTRGEFISGIHIINTSAATQVVKLRMRRGSDSMDALDFNLIMSPKDEWTGFIDDSSGNVVMATEDTTCTAPLRADGRFAMPATYRTGAEEGYMEIIAMAQTITEGEPIAIAAKHDSSGVPFDCVAAESNFFRVTGAPAAFPATGTGANGVYNVDLTAQDCTDAISVAVNGIGQSCAVAGVNILENNYVESPNALKVSYFVRDAASGLEFGSNAVHLEDFSTTAMMSNQEVIVVGQSDVFGYLFPDLDGGSPAVSPRGRFSGVRSALGATSVINDWSVAAARNVSTDWVVTLPGQYIMLDLQQYTTSLFDPAEDCLTQEQAAAVTPAPVRACDSRDIPVVVGIDTWDREEQTFSSPESGLVISPAVVAQGPGTLLTNEVNVIEWTAGTSEPVLGSGYSQVFDVSALGTEFGWAELNVSSDPAKTQGVFDFTAAPTALVPFNPLVNTAVPIVGFVAWERSFPADPSANYGRLIDHSYRS